MAAQFDQLRILVVDAAAETAGSLHAALRASGIQHVELLAGGPAALALLDTARHFDLVLCDLGALPVAGSSFIWHLRLTDPDIPILALTGGSVMADHAAMSSGADAVLHRPFAALALKIALHGLLHPPPEAPAPEQPAPAPRMSARMPPPPVRATAVFVSPAAAPDMRFGAIKRRFAMLYHPDSGVASGLAREVRSAVFKEFWPEFERVEKAGRPGIKSS